MTKSISIIIPVYNEGRHLAGCLQSIADQTVAPDEVIVVDNNSTDDSMAIAKRFRFVRIVRETKQGRAYACRAGFDAANSDLLGRINGDSKLQPDWVARARQSFIESPGLGGLTGPGITDTLPGTHRLMTTLWSRCYFRWNESVQRINTLWGANAVITADAWRAVRADVCLDDTVVHDDQDLAYLLNGAGYRVHRDNKLLITAFSQHYHHWPKLKEYTARQGSTKRWHQDRGTLRRPGARIMPYYVTAYVLGLGWPLLALFMGVSWLRYLPYRLSGRTPQALTED